MRIEGRAVLVVGLGRSGNAATRALLRHGAAVTVIDDVATAETEAAAQALLEAGATVQLHAVGDVRPSQFELVVPSPGVPAHAPVLRAAASAGVPVWSEPELAWRLAGDRVRLVAVTGTNGKTTTTEMLAACLGAPTGGNIGTPLVDLLANDDPPPLVVAELSSFQLQFTTTLRPWIAVLLNVAPDHLDWHGTLAGYRAAKARLWARQQPSDTTVLNADDGGVGVTVAEHPPPGATLRFTAQPPQPRQVGVLDRTIVARLGNGPVAVVAVDELAVSGPHNVANACAATAAALAAGATAADVAAALTAYRSGHHRLETVATRGGVAFVDDSKATNPHAAAAALASYAPRSVVWIAGGLGKGLTFEKLRPLVRRHVRVAVTIGTSGPELASMARELGVEVVEAHTLDRAVHAAAATAQPGDTVLLAPACASMDQFADYAARGDAFAAAVRALADQTQGAGRGR